MSTLELSNLPKLSQHNTQLEKTVLDQFEEQFRQFQGPEGVRQFKQAAFDRFTQLGLPSTKQEAWKYVSLNAITQQPYQAGEANTDLSRYSSLIEGLPNLGDTYRVVLVNGVVVSSNWLQYPYFSLCQWQHCAGNQTEESCSLLDHPDVLSDTNPFTHLNIALSQQAMMLTIPENTELDKVLELVFIHDADHPVSCHPQIMIRLKDQSKARLACYYLSHQESHQGFNNTLILASLGKNAHLRQVNLIDTQAEDTTFINGHVWCEDNSEYQQTGATINGQLIRDAIEVHLNGTGADAQLSGVTLLGDKSRSHNCIRLHHNTAGCTSSQVFKGILSDEAVYDFDGTIIIPRGSDQTNAEQLNKNILLSDKARVYTRPQLRIDADDVKCSHGATVGQLSAKEVFYMRSRGFDEATAKSILTVGFAQSVFSNVQNPVLKQWFCNKLENTLNERLRDTL